MLHARLTRANATAAPCPHTTTPPTGTRSPAARISPQREAAPITAPQRSAGLSQWTTDESQVELLRGLRRWETECGRGRRRVKAQTVGLWSAARLARLTSHE